MTKHDIDRGTVAISPFHIISEYEYHPFFLVKVDLRRGYFILQFHSYEINSASSKRYKFFLCHPDEEEMVVIEPLLDSSDIQPETRF